MIKQPTNWRKWKRVLMIVEFQLYISVIESSIIVQLITEKPRAVLIILLFQLIFLRLFRSTAFQLVPNGNRMDIMKKEVISIVSSGFIQAVKHSTVMS